jgi:uncharacterized protein (TIGR02611 family)
MMNNLGTRITKLMAITLAGFILLILGIIMLVAPGPGILFILLGLLILSLEYRWALKVRERIRKKAMNCLCKTKKEKSLMIKGGFKKICSYLNGKK